MKPMNPCSCNGTAWLEPDGARCHVICENCGQIETAWSASSAVLIWNQKHRPAPVRLESNIGGAWVPAGLWDVTYTDRAVIFRVASPAPEGHFLRCVNRFRMRRKRWIPGLTFRPRWSNISCRIAEERATK